MSRRACLSMHSRKPAAGLGRNWPAAGSHVIRNFYHTHMLYTHWRLYTAFTNNLTWVAVRTTKGSMLRCLSRAVSYDLLLQFFYYEIHDLFHLSFLTFATTLGLFLFFFSALVLIFGVCGLLDMPGLLIRDIPHQGDGVILANLAVCSAAIFIIVFLPPFFPRCFRQGKHAWHGGIMRV